MPPTTLLSLIGNTPLVELSRLAPKPGIRIFAKLEGQNPSGSVKDRIVMAMVEAAERRGDLKRGDTVVEASTGNTGIFPGYGGKADRAQGPLGYSEGRCAQRGRYPGRLRRGGHLVRAARGDDGRHRGGSRDGGGQGMVLPEPVHRPRQHGGTLPDHRGGDRARAAGAGRLCGGNRHRRDPHGRGPPVAREQPQRPGDRCRAAAGGAPSRPAKP